MNWVLRPIVWFAAGSMLTTILHELAHACAAFVLGVRSTLFNYSADLDMTAAQAASNLPALIRVAGPSFCLAMGILAWLAYRRARGALPLLYLSVFGLGTFVLFAVVGALAARRHIRDQSGSLELRWADGVVTLVAVLAVRPTVRGIPFIP